MENKKVITVILDIKNKKVANEINEVASTLGGFNITHKQLSLQSSGSCDILFMEIGNDPKVELQLAKSLKASGIAGEVFITSPSKDPEILIAAMRSGIKEFFPQPVKKEVVRDAMRRVQREKEEADDGNAVSKGTIINVFGSKGGVGATTVAVNLAAGLTTLKSSPSVALVDMKPVLGDVSTFLNIDASFSWLEVTKNISRLDPTYLMSILTKHSSGLYVLPSPVELTSHRENSDALVTLLKLMQNMFDFIVIDSGQSFNKMSLEVIKISDTVLLVCQLSLSSLINTKRFQDTFQKYGFSEEDKIWTIVNRFEKHSDISLKDAEESLNQKIMFSIPNTYKISMDAISSGKPISTGFSGTEIGRKYRELASAFLVHDVGKKSKKKKKKAFSLSSLFS
jgi:pilus assembly protein CpaE